MAMVNAGTDLIGVPVTASNPERTGLILQALGEESIDTITPAYFEVALQSKYSRDDVSAQMLEIIRDCRLFDVGYYYENIGGAFSSVGYTLSEQESRNFASYYAENEVSVIASMTEFLENLKK